MILNSDSMNGSEKKIFYIQNMKPVMNREALYSDETENFRKPDEPEKFSSVRIRIRTAIANVDEVFICMNDEEIVMNLVESDSMFSYYEYELSLSDKQITYYFKIVTGFETCYYDKAGICDQRLGWYDFVVTPGFKTPDWAKGAVIYQIYTDRFFNGDKTNDVETNEYSYIGDYSKKVEDWYKYPASMGVREFYGGDLQGVRIN